MTSHELAHALLSKPDVLVVLRDYRDTDTLYEHANELIELTLEPGEIARGFTGDAILIQ